MQSLKLNLEADFQLAIWKNRYDVRSLPMFIRLLWNFVNWDISSKCGMQIDFRLL